MKVAVGGTGLFVEVEVGLGVEEAVAVGLFVRLGVNVEVLVFVGGTGVLELV